MVEKQLMFRFGIPTYFDIIKHPMDVSTIDKKIIAKAYPSVDGALFLPWNN